MNNIKDPAFYMGVVEDRMDPLKLGRVRVRVVGLHTHDKTALPTADLPWAYKIQPTTSGGISGIGYAPVGVMEGTWVLVQYIDPDKQMPFVIGVMGGIPQAKQQPLENFVLTPGENQVRTGSGGVLTDGSGNPVTTGTPAETQPPEEAKAPEPQTTTEKGGCCGVVDASQLSAQFGGNVDEVCKALCSAGIKDPYAIIAILSNVAKESRFRLVRESLIYSSVARIRAVFPSSTNKYSDAELQVYVNNEEAFANFIYANKIGNGNEASGDGWKYRGGGFVQLTGRANYRSIGGKIGVDLEGNPESINDPAIAAKAVAEYMKTRITNFTYSNLDDACRAVTKAINPGGLSMDLPKVVNFSKLCYIVGEATPAQKATPAPQPTRKEPPSSPSSTGSGYKITAANADESGFKDPNKVYPLADHLNEPDTNRLARHEKIAKTSVFKKEALRHTGIRQANGTGSWNQSPIPYNSRYPYNNVWQSESGHVMEFDDTKGRERINLYHRTGTFTEVDHNGTQVNFIVGDGYHIYERNGFVHVQGALNVTVDGAHTLKVDGALDIEVSGAANINIHNSANLNVAQNLNVTAGGNMFFKAGGTIAMDASKIHFNSGFASGLRGVGARSASGVRYGPLSVLVRGEEIAVDYEVTEDDPIALEEYKSKMISEGILTREELEQPPEKVEETTPPENKAEETKVEEKTPKSVTEFTGNEQLSKFYKLGDLNMNNTKKLVATGKNTPSDIFDNLKALAVNCLDPIRARYPNVRINSGYRNDVPAGGSTTSQHLIGQAVDISFPGLTRLDLYHRVLEIQQMIPYDQLLLEYASGPGWIHISFVSGKNRKMHFTMNHHRRVSDIGKFVQIA